MNLIRKIIVCLDLTEMDDLLIQYVSFLSKKIDHIQKVFFVHNIKFEHEGEVQSILSQLDKSLEELVVDTITEKIENSFLKDNLNFEVLVEESSSTPIMIAKLTQTNDADLVIVGKKISYKGSGLVAEKLLRVPHFNKSLLLIPETAHHRIQNMVIPTDFSKASQSVFKVANYFRKKIGADLSCHYVFNIPSVYFPTIMVPDLEKTLEAKAEKKWEIFYKELQTIGITNLKCELSFGYEKNIAESIYESAIRLHKDLIIIGARSKKNVVSFMVGRVSIQLIQYDLHIPLLIVK